MLHSPRLAGLDSLLDKDWRGQGFDKEVDQLIKFIKSDKSTRRSSQVCVTSPFISAIVRRNDIGIKTFRMDLSNILFMTVLTMVSNV